jgi:hypothetical protein
MRVIIIVEMSSKGERKKLAVTAQEFDSFELVGPEGARLAFDGAMLRALESGKDVLIVSQGYLWSKKPNGDLVRRRKVVDSVPVKKGSRIRINVNRG